MEKIPNRPKEAENPSPQKKNLWRENKNPRREIFIFSPGILGPSTSPFYGCTEGFSKVLLHAKLHLIGYKSKRETLFYLPKRSVFHKLLIPLPL